MAKTSYSDRRVEQGKKVEPLDTKEVRHPCDLERRVSGCVLVNP